MGTQLRVLILEDNPSDAELVLYELRRSGYDPIATRVETEEDFREQLQLVPDVILADFSMPRFDSLYALEILQETSHDIPFIIVSGTIGEERAAEAMRRGATDYIMKDRMGRLGQAVAQSIERRASNEAKRLLRQVKDEALRQSEERYRTLIDATASIVWGSPASGEFDSDQPAWTAFTGQTLEQHRGWGWLDAIHPDDREKSERAWTVAMRARSVYHVEHRLRRADGEYRYMTGRAVPIFEPDGAIREWVGVHTDVTDQKCAESDRAKLLTELTIQIERLPLAYLLCDKDFRITRWNPAAERMFGFTQAEVLGKHPFEVNVPLHSQPYVQDFFARLATGDMDATGTAENVTKDGRTITCEWFNTPLMDDTGNFCGVISVAQDITAQQSLEAQMRQAQKMEAFGQLAGGVAHDFNNLLTIISGYSELLLNEMLPHEPMRASVKEISDAGERAASLTRQLLNFSRKAVMEPIELDLNAGVRDTTTLLRRLIGEDIQLTTIFKSKRSYVKVDPALLGQILMNLAVNARDAMPRGGKLTIESSDVVLDDANAARFVDCKPGRYVKLTISDTGCGMTPEVKAHVFEPFFTTKGPGKGTGLGLATVYGIVKQSGGSIELYSEPGWGTMFTIYFRSLDEQNAPASQERRVTAVKGGTESILVVEDEAAVRAIAVRALDAHGYTVLQAENGNKAMRIMEKHHDGIDLLVTDLVMPGVSGRELAESLAARHPKLKVLFVSGYTDDAVVRHGILRADISFLQKPYTPRSLAEKVRTVLDQR